MVVRRHFVDQLKQKPRRERTTFGNVVEMMKSTALNFSEPPSLIENIDKEKITFRLKSCLLGLKSYLFRVYTFYWNSAPDQVKNYSYIDC
jgi:hypothetical protein